MQHTLFSKKDLKTILAHYQLFLTLLNLKLPIKSLGIDDMVNFVPNVSRFHITSILREDTK